MWRVLSRLRTVRLLLLASIVAAGPTGVASSWHSALSLEHRFAASLTGGTDAALEAGALPPDAQSHCVICQFGVALRAWSVPSSSACLSPPHDYASRVTPSVAPLQHAPVVSHAGRAPPRLA